MSAFILGFFCMTYVLTILQYFRMLRYTEHAQCLCANAERYAEPALFTSTQAVSSATCGTTSKIPRAPTTAADTCQRATTEEYDRARRNKAATQPAA